MLLIPVSETLTVDCGTLIFENANKNGTRGISVKFRSNLGRILIKKFDLIERIGKCLFLDTAVLV